MISVTVVPKSAHRSALLCRVWFYFCNSQKNITALQVFLFNNSVINNFDTRPTIRDWYQGYLCKLKTKNMPCRLFILLKPYLEDRFFRGRYESKITPLHPLRFSVSQGSVLGPILYLIFSANLPTTQNVITSTFADDTAVLAKNPDPRLAATTWRTYGYSFLV